MSINHRNLKNALLFIPNVLVFTAIGIACYFRAITEEPLQIIIGFIMSGILVAFFSFNVLIGLPTHLLIPALIACSITGIVGMSLLIVGMSLLLALLFISIGAHKFGTWWVDENGKLIRVN